PPSLPPSLPPAHLRQRRERHRLHPRARPPRAPPPSLPPRLPYPSSLPLPHHPPFQRHVLLHLSGPPFLPPALRLRLPPALRLAPVRGPEQRVPPSAGAGGGRACISYLWCVRSGTVRVSSYASHVEGSGASALPSPDPVVGECFLPFPLPPALGPFLPPALLLGEVPPFDFSSCPLTVRGENRSLLHRIG
ncbi:hypothetical protein Naga_101954g1, partial [Nannochloropsis gaditana]